MNNPIIQLKDLSKCYGSAKAVDKLNLEIYKGEIFGLLGPNGAGKTTTILMMLGLTEPTQGTAKVCGLEASKSPIIAKKKIGYMPDNVGFYENMTALENLAYIGQLNGMSASQAQKEATEMLDLVGLGKETHKKTGAYSRGMKQRLGLAEVLIKKPEVIILDEPTLGIDPSGVKDFLALIKQLSKQQQLTVLLSSHHLHHVQQVCDRVGIFVQGKLLAQGDIATLSQHLFGKNGHIVNLNFATKNAETEHLETLKTNFPGVTAYQIAEKQVTLTCTHHITPNLVRFFVEKGYDIEGVSQKAYGLDDIYEKYFDNVLIDPTKNEKSNTIFKRSFFKKK